MTGDKPRGPPASRGRVFPALPGAGFPRPPRCRFSPPSPVWVCFLRGLPGPRGFGFARPSGVRVCPALGGSGLPLPRLAGGPRGLSPVRSVPLDTIRNNSNIPGSGNFGSPASHPARVCPALGGSGLPLRVCPALPGAGFPRAFPPLRGASEITRAPCFFEL
jgi:hypothetical protein